MWIPFKYEKLGLFCYKCGRIRNHQNICKFPPGNERFGPWLRVEWRVECSSNNQLVVKKHSENFTLIPSPNLLAWTEVEDDEDLNDLENATPPKNELIRLTINGVDSVLMMLNCAVIACRVAEANEVKGYGWLIIMMIAYFFYLVLKFDVMGRRFGFFRTSNSSEGSSMVEYSRAAQLKDFLILVIFCIAFLVSCLFLCFSFS
ncbi:hypothetical protein CQW23_07329 [Capsicum baccatum]|uniref:Zinc knuckle CX2CX4HX4C domain-containing protein n=1 Tax=Capsicum baccatum TaxID=33114 RepID=A0A2G2X5X8_CAPBA|nr:hypothetical protein CQW23_07329 [Capsicum baccatum]